jgi:hypothetical protein
MRGHLHPPRRRDESGAVLVLALIFMVLTAVIITSLAAWEGTNLKDIGAVKYGRSTLYSSNGAVQVAIANTRYTYPSNTGLALCPNSSTQQSTNPFTIDTVSVAVTCQTTLDPTCPSSIGICTRQETLTAYPAADCTSTSCTGNYFVQAVVYFDDYSSSSANDCNPLGAQTTCGSSMSIYSWIVASSVTT